MDDATFTIGVDDRELARGLRTAEGRVSKSFGRVGDVIDSKTKGLRKFTGALSGVAGVATGLIGVVGTIGVVAGLVGTIANQAQKEAEARKKSREELDAMLDSMRRATSGGALGGSLADITREADAARSKLGLLGDPDRAAAASAEIDALERRLRFEKLIVPVIDRQVELYKQRQRLLASLAGRGIGGAPTGSGRIDQAEALRDIRVAEAAEQRNKDIARAAALRKQGKGDLADALIRDASETFRLAKQAADTALRDTERAALRTAQDETDQIRADALRAEGAFAAAEAIEREMAARRQLLRINEDLYLNERERAEAAENLRRKQRADQQNAQRERQRQAESFRESLEMTALRAQGRGEEADAIQRQIDLAERLSRIDQLRRGGAIDADEATRLRGLAQGIAESRGPGSFISAPLGLGAGARAQALGVGGMGAQVVATKQSTAATEKNTRATMELTAEMRRARQNGSTAQYAA